MTPEFEEALGLWERGELSRDELARRFPDEDIAGVLDAFDRLSAAAVGPTSDAGPAWDAVRAQLPVRLADRRRGRGKAIRLLAAAMIAVLTLGATAYAVVPSVRRALNDAVGVTTGDPDGSPRPTLPSDITGSEEDRLSPYIPDGRASITDADDGGAVENESEADANEDDADGGSNAGSNDGSIDDGVEGDSGSGTDEGSVDDGSVSDGGSVGDDSGSGEERASDAVGGDSSDSGSEDPE